MISVFDADPRFNCLSSGSVFVDEYKAYPITIGQYISRYYELWTRNVIAKVCLSTETDVAYGYADKPNVLRGLKFERYCQGTFYLKRIKDDRISHVYYQTYEVVSAMGFSIQFTYFYLAKVDFSDEIICLQRAEDEEGKAIFLPLSFQHTEEQVMQMFYRILNLRFNCVQDD